MNVGILGSGFGLYGYLPSLLSMDGISVTLPQRYMARVRARDDIRHLASRIDWVGDEALLLDRCNAVVVTQRPDDQVTRLPDILNRPQLRSLLLEKPVAPTPALATRVLGMIEDAGLRVRIGYTFRHTSWGQRLMAALQGGGDPADAMEIVWRFRAHHHTNNIANWKRLVASGGGALRFYGIHIVGFLAECGYDDVMVSQTQAGLPGEADVWCATFIGPALPPCRVLVDSNAAATIFSVSGTAGGEPIEIAMADPFDGAERILPFDRRMNVISALCRDFLGDGPLSYPWYHLATKLWAQVESVNVTTTGSAHPADAGFYE